MSGYPRFALDGNAILFTTERYGMRAHASWGSLNDAMLVFLNQDAYDKYCLSKEDIRTAQGAGEGTKEVCRKRHPPRQKTRIKRRKTTRKTAMLTKKMTSRKTSS